MKAWRSFHECCPGCLGRTVVYGEGKPARGDLAFCRGCQCQGLVDVDPWGFYIEWPVDVCAKCYRRLDKALDGLFRRVLREIKIERVLDEMEAAADGE